MRGRAAAPDFPTTPLASLVRDLGSEPVAQRSEAALPFGALTEVGADRQPQSRHYTRGGDEELLQSGHHTLPPVAVQETEREWQPFPTRNQLDHVLEEHKQIIRMPGHGPQ